MVLDRLLYRNRSQHRSGKYFTRVVEVRETAMMLKELPLRHCGKVMSMLDR